MNTIAGILAILTLAGAPSLAQTRTDIASPGNGAAATKPVKPKKICRSDRTTGSRLSSSTCLTAEQWAERDAATKDDMDNARRQGGSFNRPGAN